MFNDIESICGDEEIGINGNEKCVERASSYNNNNNYELNVNGE